MIELKDALSLVNCTCFCDNAPLAKVSSPPPWWGLTQEKAKLEQLHASWFCESAAINRQSTAQTRSLSKTESLLSIWSLKTFCSLTLYSLFVHTEGSTIEQRSCGKSNLLSLSSAAWEDGALHRIPLLY